MTSHRRSVRLALFTVVGCGLIAATSATPGVRASASPTRTDFTQPSPIFLGDADIGAGWAQSFEIPAEVGDSHDLIVERPGAIASVEVTVAFGDTVPSDVEMLLRGPHGQQVVLLNGVGGEDPLSEVELTFTGSGEILDEGAELADGDVRPASFGELGLAEVAGPSVGTDLSVFKGTQAKGAWQLFVVNAEGLGTGEVYEWALKLATETSPYPSALPVSGLGKVTDVNLTLDGLVSEYPADCDFLLVGPRGQRAMVFSDAGRGDEVAVHEPVDLTFDDDVAAKIAAELDAPITTGTYQPSSYDSPDTFPVLGVVEGVTSRLDVFDGTDPNGVWRLYAVDDAAGNVSSIQGWSLHIETNDLTAPSGGVVVAGGSAYATATAVTLGLAATDPGPGASGVRQMRFSNDNTSFSAWQPYAPTAAWTLARGKDGVRTVYAQYADGAGNVSPAVTDTVTLDTTAPTATRLTPSKDAKGVSPTARIKVKATERLDSATVSARTMLLKHGSKKVRAEVSLKKGTIIVLEPKKALARGTYKVTVSTKVTDLAGNAFDAARKQGTQTLTWTFTV